MVDRLNKNEYKDSDRIMTTPIKPGHPDYGTPNTSGPVTDLEEESTTSVRPGHPDYGFAAPALPDSIFKDNPGESQA